jgi:hypothetical protein
MLLVPALVLHGILTFHGEILLVKIHLETSALRAFDIYVGKLPSCLRVIGRVLHYERDESRR